MMGTRRIPLHARGGSVRAYALVDAEDFSQLSQWRWFVAKNGGHAVRVDVINGVSHSRRMHRLIPGLAEGDTRDGEHENGDPLDNRRSNLRPATRAQNQQNRRGPQRNGTSGYRGVTFDRARGKWTAKVQVAGRTHNLGRFDTPQDADAAARAFRTEHMPYSQEAA